MNLQGNLASDHRGRVALEDPQDVQYWTRHLGVGERTLRDAVKLVGDAADEVMRHLSEHPGGKPEPE